MTSQELDHALAQLGMTQSGAARYFGSKIDQMAFRLCVEMPGKNIG
jgi:hypothetical protein